MKFPGRRKTKHYFPVTEKGRTALSAFNTSESNVYIVGIDQLLVDIEIEVSDDFLDKYDFNKGESFIIDDALCEEVYAYAKEHKMIRGEFPGGAVGNTLHNFSILSESPCFALGAIKKNIEVGDYAFGYISNTHSLVNLSHLHPCTNHMGRALCFITPDCERTFAISKGCMNDLGPEDISEELISGAGALLISAYALRSETDPICSATIRACEYAKKHNIPVVMSMGTSSLVKEKREFLLDFAEKYISVLAMNQDEAQALTGEEDALLASDYILNYVDMALVTVGKKGLYLSAYTEDSIKRETQEPLVTKSIVNYNQYEYSRAVRKSDCQNPIKIYTHISPFNGGPLAIKNTNGAGDAALSALLHDLTANLHHRHFVPNSPKHDSDYLTYSSISQISKYANRVSFEVLSQNSPRLFKPLPDREDSLEDGYWSQ